MPGIIFPVDINITGIAHPVKSTIVVDLSIQFAIESVIRQVL